MQHPSGDVYNILVKCIVGSKQNYALSSSEISPTSERCSNATKVTPERRSETSNSSEVAIRRCSVEKMFLKISHDSQENTCPRVSFLIKLQGLGLQIY